MELTKYKIHPPPKKKRWDLRSGSPWITVLKTILKQDMNPYMVSLFLFINGVSGTDVSSIFQLPVNEENMNDSTWREKHLTSLAVVKNLHFQHRDWGFDPWLGNEDSTCYVAWPKTIKKYKQKLDCYKEKKNAIF